MIPVFILSLLVVTIAAWWIVARRRQRAARPDDIPLFTVPAAAVTGISRPARRTAERRQHTPRPVPIPPPARSDSPIASHPAYAAGDPPVRTRDGQVAALAGPARSPSTSADDVGEAIEGASIRYWRAADGTLQFLPGRLEVAAGRDAGQEIRFVRTGGPDGTSVTFGRAEGAPYRHVQLREPTVSRTHARMSLETGQPTSNVSPSRGTTTAANAPHWRIENLSATNPVIVNGRALRGDAGPRASVILSEGDRIEMGEVAFVFRAR